MPIPLLFVRLTTSCWHEQTLLCNPDRAGPEVDAVVERGHRDLSSGPDLFRFRVAQHVGRGDNPLVGEG